MRTGHRHDPQGLRQSAAFHQLQIDAVDAVRQLRDIRREPYRFIDVDRQRTVFEQFWQLVFRALHQRLFDIVHALLRQPFHHDFRVFERPAAVGIDAQSRMERRGGFFRRHEMTAIRIQPIR